MRNRRVGVTEAAACALVPLLLVLAACSSGGSDSTPPGPRVLVVGDSLTVGTRLGNLGLHDPAEWTIDARQGRKTEAGIEPMAGHDPSSFDRVFVALGTNDYTDSEAEFASKIDQMMAVIGTDVPVTWVNVDTGTDTLAGVETGVNAALARAPERHANLTIADWSTYVNGRPDVDSLRAGDGVHYDLEGYDVRARWMESLANS